MRERFWLVLLTIPVILSGCGTSSKETSVQANVPAVYSQNCASCHGQQLEGSFGGPSLTKEGSSLTTDKIKTIITKGSGTMSGYEKALKPEDITTLTTYLASKK